MKTKALISCAATAQLICTFVYPYTKVRFSHDAAQITKKWQLVIDFQDMTILESVTFVSTAFRVNILGRSRMLELG